MSREVVGEWASTTLKEAAGELFTDGDWVESKDQDPGGEVRLIQLADIGDGSFLNKSARFLTTDKARELRCTLLQPGDLLIARMADPIARCCIFPGLDQSAATVVDISIVRPGPEVDREYLAYAVSNPVFRLEALGSASGSTRSRISRSNLGVISVPLPPLDEQRRIADVLRSVDEAIAAAKSAATQARCALDGLLFEYFSESGAYASRFDFSPLSDLTILQSGFAFKSDEYQEHGHFLMRISNVQDGQVSLENPKFVTLNQKTQAFELQVGDILTSLTGNIGRVARLTADHLPAALNQRVARIKPKPSASIDADYLFFSLKSPLFKAGLAGESGGAAQQNVSPKAIGRVEIPLPPTSEQKRIGEMLCAIEHTKVQSELALEHLTQSKVLLMSDLLAGRVRVPK